MLFMIFDGLKKRERALLVGILNSDPRAYLKLSRGYYATYLPIPGCPKGDASKVLRGMPSLNRRTGKYFYRLVDVDALRQIDPDMKKRSVNRARLVKYLDELRELPLEILKTVVSQRLWRCDRCQQFFEAKDLRYRRYCSPECGHNQEAEKAVDIARVSGRARKLKRARAPDARRAGSSVMNLKRNDFIYRLEELGSDSGPFAAEYQPRP